MTKQEFKNNIFNYFRVNSGMTITEAKKQLVREEEHGSSSITVGNVTLMYTTNPNYAGGRRMGNGKGFYIRACNNLASRQEIKI